MLKWIKGGINDIHETVTGRRNVKLVQEHLQDTDRLLEACLSRIEIIAMPVGNQDNPGILRSLRIMAWLAIGLALISIALSICIIASR